MAAPQLTPRAIILAVVLAMILAAASQPGLAAIPFQLPFAAAMVVLAMRVWSDARTLPGPTAVPGG